MSEALTIMDISRQMKRHPDDRVSAFGRGFQEFGPGKRLLLSARYPGTFFKYYFRSRSKASSDFFLESQRLNFGEDAFAAKVCPAIRALNRDGFFTYQFHGDSMSFVKYDVRVFGEQVPVKVYLFYSRVGYPITEAEGEKRKTPYKAELRTTSEAGITPMTRLLVVGSLRSFLYRHFRIVSETNTQ